MLYQNQATVCIEQVAVAKVHACTLQPEIEHQGIVQEHVACCVECECEQTLNMSVQCNSMASGKSGCDHHVPAGKTIDGDVHFVLD